MDLKIKAEDKIIFKIHLYYSKVIFGIFFDKYEKILIL